MPNDYPRSHRVADFIHRELAGMIRSELRDPGLSPMLTLTAVEVSRDLSVARVYYSLVGEDDREASHEALRRASGYLRRELARRLQTRSVPELRFHFDESALRGSRMSALIDAAVSTNTTAPDTDTAGERPLSTSPARD